MRKALRYAAAVLVLLLALTGCWDRSGPRAERTGETQPPVQAEEVQEKTTSEAPPVQAPEEVQEEAPEPVSDPAPPEEAEPEPEEAPADIRGRSPDTTVYVSKRSSTIHSIPDCCNMKHYREMTLADADAKGYSYCSHCF